MKLSALKKKYPKAIVVSDGTKILYVDDIQEFKKVAPGRKGYQSHFASCKFANQHRSKK